MRLRFSTWDSENASDVPDFVLLNRAKFTDIVRGMREWKSMQNNSRKMWMAVVAGAALTVMLGASATVRAEEHKTNACGCYQKLDGSCVCGRPSKCGCPGECEPKGCEEKRQKEIDKEIQAETKKAED